MHALTRTVAGAGLTVTLLLAAGPAATAAAPPASLTAHVAGPVAATGAVQPQGLGDFVGGLPCKLFGMC